MSERIHALAQHLFGKASVEDCSVQEVQTLVQRFPYFAPAQFLLLEKLKQEGSGDYPAQVQKAILYYHNPLEFQHFISSDRFYTEANFEEALQDHMTVPGEVAFGTVTLQQEDAPRFSAVATPTPVETSVFPDAFGDVDHDSQDEAPGVTIPTMSAEPIAAKTEASPETDLLETSAPAQPEVSAFSLTESALAQAEPETKPASDMNLTAPQPGLDADPYPTAPMSRNEADSIEELVQGTHQEPARINGTGSSLKEPDTDPGTGTTAPLDQQPQPVDTNPVFPEKGFRHTAIEISSPTARESEPLAFEPYHTVDYFASQGIKLSQEEAPKDKFGKQLKSFTEWLKTMKRLPQTQMVPPVDAGTETTVKHLAEDSVHEANVWTEAMAEVWLKQGNTQKAIEVYHKLSLLNPSKLPYFAAKIENLKRP